MSLPDPSSVKKARADHPFGTDGGFWSAVGRGLPDPVLILDGKGLILAANGPLLVMAGVTESEIAGQPVTHLLEDMAFELFPPNLKDVRLRTRDGRRLPMESAWSCLPMDFPGDQPKAVYVGVLRELTQRLDCRESLGRAEERLAALTANLPGVLFQREQGTDGQLRYPFFSEGVRQILGLGPDELRVASDGCLDVVHWADRDEHLAVVRRSAASLEPCREEFRVITKDGDVRWLSGSSQPRMQADGTLRWDGLLLDVTDRKRAEQKLQMIMDHAADSILTLDMDGHIESVNAAVESLFGYAADEMIGQSYLMLVPEAHRAYYRDLLERYLESGEAQIIGRGPREFVGRRKDGSTFPFEIATSEVRMEGRRLFIGIGRDITDRKKTEADLKETQRRLSEVTANMPGLLFQRALRPDGRIEYPFIGDGIRDMFGMDPAEIKANPALMIDAVDAAMRGDFLEKVRESARTLEPVELDLLIHGYNGRTCWTRSSSRPRLLGDGSVMWEGIILDVTDRKKAEDQISYLAYHDPLTKTANRSLLLERFAEAAESGEAGKLLAMVSIGIDRFSIINTTLGHAFGDQLLVKLAERLSTCLSSGDTLARVGGDRFMLLLAGLSDNAEIMITVEQILTRLQDPIAVGEEEIEITASAGVSLYPLDGPDGETLVKNADAALLRAKSSGSGSSHRFVPEMNAGVVRTMSLQSRLRRALEQEEFVAFFQPQVDLVDGGIVGMEALVRWMSPAGMVPPAEFIPVAEELGLIDGICEQVLKSCCTHLRHWRDEGLSLVPVAVNISGRQFQQPKRLVSLVEEALSENGLDPRLLELELTESSAMTDPQSAIAVVERLREHGVACAIDDFGTGYSSLSVLKGFPISKLKIDRSFVMDIDRDPNDAAIVTAIVAMAHALKLKVVAEGVETQQHLDFLRNLGCDQIQGYLFSRPVPASDMREMLRTGRRLALSAR
ncbi:MAG TPA: EAL domain-containing protein [Candidatus Sulfotelmatobacter sp.]|jgi:diguanylate cyclase (GGDEF)-like protein/PAS domain S-box-containing protein|nr:EAL domain-containing protein [Candidatus Sulfotelmatobacter sp.]